MPKNRKIRRILAIESSCDETAAAVIDASSLCHPELAEESPFPVVLSNIVSSQIDLHKLTGGVVPEVAARAHLEAIMPVIEQALIEARKLENANIENLFSDIDAIAVTNGPGLIGALLIGFNTAKTLSYALNIPIIPINHIEGHIYSALGAVVQSRKSRVQSKDSSDSRLGTRDFPTMALTVSGGHTSLTLVKDHGKYETIGETVDDAAGEAFDKVAKLLNLGYPGGPAVSKLAEQFRNGVQSPKSKVQRNTTGDSGPGTQDFTFPRPMLHSGDFNFSFSGLKTAVLHKVRELTDNGQRIADNEKAQPKKPSREVSSDSSGVGFSISDTDKAEICAAFEDAVADVLISKTLAAAEHYGVKNIIVAGGVSANKHLRSEFVSRLGTRDFGLIFPSPDMTGDNAAMIGLAAAYRVKCHPELVSGSNWDKVSVDSNLRL